MAILKFGLKNTEDIYPYHLIIRDVKLVLKCTSKLP